MSDPAASTWESNAASRMTAFNGVYRWVNSNENAVRSLSAASSSGSDNPVFCRIFFNPRPCARFAASRSIQPEARSRADTSPPPGTPAFRRKEMVLHVDVAGVTTSSQFISAANTHRTSSYRDR